MKMGVRYFSLGNHLDFASYASYIPFPRNAIVRRNAIYNRSLNGLTVITGVKPVKRWIQLSILTPALSQKFFD
jgi:hypothetical protein